MRKSIFVLALLLGFSFAFASAALAVAECDFSGPPTAAQLAACQAASAASGSSSAAVTSAPTSMPDGVSAQPEQKGPPADLAEKINAQKLKGMKSGMRGMETALNKMKASYAKLEKQGIVIPQDIKNKFTRAQQIIDTIKNATQATEIESLDPDEFSNIMSDLGDAQGTLMERFQKMKAMKKAAGSMEKGVIAIEKVVLRIQKQGGIVPQEMTDNIAKMKTLIAGIKAEKSYEELVPLGIDEMDELMGKISDATDMFEMLLRWPMAAKQMDKQIIALDKTAIRLQATVEKLKVKGVDLSEELAKFNEGLAKLKAVRADGEAKMKAGQPAEAFDNLEENFINQMDNVIEYQRIIEAMTNLGRFNSEFKKGLATAQQGIRQLKKNKVDTAEIEALISSVSAKANEIIALIKTKPIDENTVADKIAAYEDSRQIVMDKLEELLKKPMPWEQGKSQIKDLTMPKELDKYVDELKANK